MNYINLGMFLSIHGCIICRDNVIVKNKKGGEVGKGTFICTGTVSMILIMLLLLSYTVNDIYGKVLLEKNYCKDQDIELPTALGLKTLFKELKVE